jgi:hypothetical protein
VQLKPFLLDMWLDKYEHDIEFNLGGSEGPSRKVNEILSLTTDEQRERFLNHKVVYSRPAGAEGLRAAIADMQGVATESPNRLELRFAIIPSERTSPVWEHCRNGVTRTDGYELLIVRASRAYDPYCRGHFHDQVNSQAPLLLCTARSRR